MIDSSVILFSHNLEKTADIPAPQREIEHGLKEDVSLGAEYMFAADGTVYARDYESHLYRLNTDTYGWEDMGDVPEFYANGSFCRKYVSRNDSIYDRITGEQIFEYVELYPAVSDWTYTKLCDFGGNKYFGVKDNEYRWVNLKDLNMSDRLPC